MTYSPDIQDFVRQYRDLGLREITIARLLRVPRDFLAAIPDHRTQPTEART